MFLDVRKQNTTIQSDDRLVINTFVTPTSLINFPIASAAVRIVCDILGVVKSNFVLPLAVAFVLGMLFYISTDDRGKTPKDRTIRLGVAVINCFFLAVAAVGIGTLVDSLISAITPPPYTHHF